MIEDIVWTTLVRLVTKYAFLAFTNANRTHGLRRPTAFQAFPSPPLVHVIHLSPDPPCADTIGELYQENPAEDYLSKEAFCQDLDILGLLEMLLSAESEQLGFCFD